MERDSSAKEENDDRLEGTERRSLRRESEENIEVIKRKKLPEQYSSQWIQRNNRNLFKYLKEEVEESLETDDKIEP